MKRAGIETTDYALCSVSLWQGIGVNGEQQKNEVQPEDLPFPEVEPAGAASAEISPESTAVGNR